MMRLFLFAVSFLMMSFIAVAGIKNQSAAGVSIEKAPNTNSDSLDLISLLDSLALQEKNTLLKRHFESVKRILTDTTHGREFSRGSVDVTEVLQFFKHEGARWETYVNGPRPLIMAFQSPTDKKNTFYSLYLPKNFDPSKKDYSFYMELHGSGGGYNDNPRHMMFEPLRLEPAGVTVQGYRKEGLYIYPWGRGDKKYKGISETDIFECLRDFDSLFKTNPHKQYLYGFSMGGAGTFHIAQLSPSRWTAIGMYSAAFDSVSQKEANKFKDIPVWMVWGEKEVWAINDRKLKDYFLKAGVKIDWYEKKGVEHEYSGEYQVKLMDWFLKQDMPKKRKL